MRKGHVDYYVRLVTGKWQIEEDEEDIKRSIGLIQKLACIQ